MQRRTVVLLAFDGAQPLDVTGPHEVFAGANEALGGPVYDLSVAAPTRGGVRSPSGLVLGVDRDLRTVPPVDTLLVAGGKYSSRTDVAPPTGSPPLDQIKLLTLDYAEYKNEREDILQKMTDIFGGEWGI